MLQDHDITLSELKKLSEVVNQKYDFDFSNYAVSSFKRRVSRFLTMEKITNTEALQQKLISNRELFNKFLEEITVNTTEMFRSPDMWKVLREEVFPKLAYKNPIRIWHAGCSSGEEVYSMAILLRELGLEDKVQTVATDINNNVIDKAEQGEYSMRNMDTNQENYVAGGGSGNFKDYYTVSESGLKVTMDPTLLKNVKFYTHDLVKGKAFGKFDIILCRNVMIYFDHALQDKVFNLFMESQSPSGYFIIGSRESMILSSTSPNYKVISDKNKIYQLKA